MILGLITYHPKFGGRTALHMAACKDIREQAPLVTRLLAAGADPAEMDDAGNTALHCAAVRGNSEALKILLAHPSGKQLVNVQNGITFQSGTTSCVGIYCATPLHVAFEAGDIQSIKLLLGAGASLTQHTNSIGMTPIEYAEVLAKLPGRKEFEKALFLRRAKEASVATLQQFWQEQLKRKSAQERRQLWGGSSTATMIQNWLLRGAAVNLTPYIQWEIQQATAVELQRMWKAYLQRAAEKELQQVWRDKTQALNNN